MERSFLFLINFGRLHFLKKVIHFNEFFHLNKYAHNICSVSFISAVLGGISFFVSSIIHLLRNIDEDVIQQNKAVNQERGNMELVDSNPKGQGRKVLGDNCVVDFESLNLQRRRGPGIFFKKKKKWGGAG